MPGTSTFGMNREPTLGEEFTEDAIMEYTKVANIEDLTTLNEGDRLFIKRSKDGDKWTYGQMKRCDYRDDDGIFELLYTAGIDNKRKRKYDLIGDVPFRLVTIANSEKVAKKKT